MRIAAISLLALLGACGGDGPMPLDVAQNKQMIWEVIKQYHDCVDKNEIGQMEALFAADPSLVLSHDADVIRGKEQVLKAIENKIDALDQKNRSTITGKEVIRPEGTTALVTYVASVGAQRGLITVVCTRSKDNKWLIQHIHDTWSLEKPPKKP